MVILGWKYHQHFCFRQQGKSKVGEHNFYSEHYIQLSTLQSWCPGKLFTLGTNPTTWTGKVAFLWASAGNKNGGSLPSRMCCFVTTTPASSLPHLSFLTLPSLLFLDCLNPERWRKECSLNMLTNCLPVCVLSCHKLFTGLCVVMSQHTWTSSAPL